MPLRVIASTSTASGRRPRGTTRRKTLDIETLAEGIEDQAQLETLQREHCDQGQGFLFSRPLDVNGVEDFLNAARSTTQPLAIG
jgi:sensor c-di-GMP phosphodiesterase-like protein